MENRVTRVCEQCGTQYPDSIKLCPQDGEPTIAATTAHIPAGRSAAVLLGSFFAQNDLDARATSAAISAPLKKPVAENMDDFIIEEPMPGAEENATRRALKAVDFAGQRKSLVSVYEPTDNQETAFAMKPVRKTIPPVLDHDETSLLPKSKKSPSLALEPNLQGTTRSSAVTDPEIAVGTTRSAAVTDPEIIPLPSKKSPAIAPEIEVQPKKSPSQLMEKPRATSNSKATVADVEAPKLTSKALAEPTPQAKPLTTAELKPIDPRALDDWKIEKPLPSKVLRSVPLAQTGKRPSVTKKYIGAGLLLSLLCALGFGLWSLLDHAVEKKELLSEQAPVVERVEISLRSNPSGARISGTINGEPFSPRFSPGTLTAPKGAEIEVSFEYSNYTPSSDHFIADTSREISVHLALAPQEPVSQPQQVATVDPKPVTTVSTKANKAPTPKPKNQTTVTTKTTSITSTNGKKNPLPAKPEL